MPQVNISLKDEDEAMLNKMAEADGFDNRSAFVRRLIRLEFARRQVISISTLPHPADAEPVPVVDMMPVEVQ